MSTDEYATRVGKRTAYMRLMVERHGWSGTSGSNDRPASRGVAEISLQVGEVEDPGSRRLEGGSQTTASHASGSVMLYAPSIRDNSVEIAARNTVNPSRRPLAADEVEYLGALAHRPASSSSTRPSVLHKPRISSSNHHLSGSPIVKDSEGGVVAMSSPFRRPVSRLQAAAQLPTSPAMVSASIEAQVHQIRRNDSSLAAAERSVRAEDRMSTHADTRAGTETGLSSSSGTSNVKGLQRQHSAYPGYDGVVAVLEASASHEARQRHVAPDRQGAAEALTPAPRSSAVRNGQSVALGSYHSQQSSGAYRLESRTRNRARTPLTRVAGFEGSAVGDRERLHESMHGDAAHTGSADLGGFGSMGLHSLSAGGESGMELVDPDAAEFDGQPAGAERAPAPAQARTPVMEAGQVAFAAQYYNHDSTQPAMDDYDRMDAMVARTMRRLGSASRSNSAAGALSPPPRPQSRLLGSQRATRDQGYSSVVDPDVATDPRYRRPVSRAISSRASYVDADPLLRRDKMRIFNETALSASIAGAEPSDGLVAPVSASASVLPSTGSIAALDLHYRQAQVAIDAAMQARRRASATHRKRFLLESRGSSPRRRSTAHGGRRVHSRGGPVMTSGSRSRSLDPLASSGFLPSSTYHRGLVIPGQQDDDTGFAGLIESGSSRAERRAASPARARGTESFSSSRPHTGVHSPTSGGAFNSTDWNAGVDPSSSAGAEGEFQSYVLSGTDQGASGSVGAAAGGPSPLRPRPSTAGVLPSSRPVLDSSFQESMTATAAVKLQEANQRARATAPELPAIVADGTKIPALLSLFRKDVLAADLSRDNKESAGDATIEPIYRDHATKYWRYRVWPVAILPEHAAIPPPESGQADPSAATARSDISSRARPYRAHRMDFMSIQLLASTLQEHLALDHALQQLASVLRELSIHRQSESAREAARRSATRRGSGRASPAKTGGRRARRSSISIGRPSSREYTARGRGLQLGTTRAGGRGGHGSGTPLHGGDRRSRFSFFYNDEPAAGLQATSVLSDEAKVLEKAPAAVEHVLRFLLLWSGHLRTHEYEAWVDWVKEKFRKASAAGYDGQGKEMIGVDSKGKQGRHHHHHHHHHHHRRHNRRDRTCAASHQYQGHQSQAESIVPQRLARLIRLGALARFNRDAASETVADAVLSRYSAQLSLKRLLESDELHWTMSYESITERPDPLYSYGTDMLQAKGPPIEVVRLASDAIGWDATKYYVPFAQDILQAQQVASGPASRPTGSAAPRVGHHHRYQAALLAVQVAARIRKDTFDSESEASATAGVGSESKDAEAEIESSSVAQDGAASTDSDDEPMVQPQYGDNGDYSESNAKAGTSAEPVPKAEKYPSVLRMCLSRHSAEVLSRGQDIMQMCFHEAIRLVHADEWTSSTKIAREQAKLAWIAAGKAAPSSAELEAMLPAQQGGMVLLRSSDPDIPNALSVAPLLQRVWTDRYIVGAKLLREARQEAKVYDQILQQTVGLSKAARHEMRKAVRQGKKLNRIARELRRQLLAMTYVVFPWGQGHEYETPEGWDKRASMVVQMRRNARAEGQGDWMSMLDQAHAVEDHDDGFQSSPRRKVYIGGTNAESTLVESPVPGDDGDVLDSDTDSGSTGSGSTGSSSYSGSYTESGRSSYSDSDYSDSSSSGSYSSTGSDSSSVSGSASTDEHASDPHRSTYSHRDRKKDRRKRRRKRVKFNRGDGSSYDSSGSSESEAMIRRSKSDGPRFDDKFSDSGGSVQSDRWQGQETDESGADSVDSRGKRRQRGRRSSARRRGQGDGSSEEGGGDSGPDSASRGEKRHRERRGRRNRNGKGNDSNDESDDGEGAWDSGSQGSQEGESRHGDRRHRKRGGTSGRSSRDKSRRGAEGRSRRGASGRHDPKSDGWDGGSQDSQSDGSAAGGDAAGGTGSRRGRRKGSRRGYKEGPGGAVLRKQGSAALLDLMDAADGDEAGDSNSEYGSKHDENDVDEFGIHGGDRDRDGEHGGAMNDPFEGSLGKSGRTGRARGGPGSRSGAAAGAGQPGGNHGWPIDEETLAGWCGVDTVADLRSIATDVMDKKKPYRGMSAAELEQEARELWESLLVQQREANDIKSGAKKRAIEARRAEMQEVAWARHAEIDIVDIGESAGAVVAIEAAGIPGLRTVAVQTDG